MFIVTTFLKRCKTMTLLRKNSCYQGMHVSSIVLYFVPNVLHYYLYLDIDGCFHFSRLATKRQFLIEEHTRQPKLPMVYI